MLRQEDVDSARTLTSSSCLALRVYLEISQISRLCLVYLGNFQVITSCPRTQIHELMARIRTKRYFRYHDIDANGLQAVLDVLTSGFDSWTYSLRYATEDIEVNRIADVKSLIATKGPTRRYKLKAKSNGGRWACFDALSSNAISVECFSSHIDPDVKIDAIQQALGLIPLERLIDTTFVAHGFDDIGKAYAGEARLFFEALGIKVETGEYYEPGNVPDKVKARIENCDMFVAIVTPQDDHTWITQETMFADSKGKQPVVMVDNSVDYKAGMLGDKEYIPFTAGHLSEGFIRILQGLNKLRGTT